MGKSKDVASRPEEALDGIVRGLAVAAARQIARGRSAVSALQVRGLRTGQPNLPMPPRLPTGVAAKYALQIFGSPGRIRTSDQPVNSRLLYH